MYKVIFRNGGVFCINMKNNLVHYLSKYIEINSELEKALEENLFIKEFPRGTVLLRQGVSVMNVILF